jgi:hypothetical protein
MQFGLDLNIGGTTHVYMSDIAACREPLLTPDQLDALGDEIASFAVRIDIAEHALLTRLRLFDAHEAWGRSGALSCANWLSWRTGVGIKAAREKVRVARALGQLSERLTRAYRRFSDGSGEPNNVGELLQDKRRYVRQSQTLGGMVQIKMQLPPEEAAIIWAAIASALGTSLSPVEGPEASAEASSTRSSQLPDPQPPDEQRADALVNVARAYLKHQPRTLGSTHELVIVTTKQQLEHGPGGVGGLLRDGTPIPLLLAHRSA